MFKLFKNRISNFIEKILEKRVLLQLKNVIINNIVYIWVVYLLFTFFWVFLFEVVNVKLLFFICLNSVFILVLVTLKYQQEKSLHYINIIFMYLNFLNLCFLYYLDIWNILVLLFIR